MSEPPSYEETSGRSRERSHLQTLPFVEVIKKTSPTKSASIAYESNTRKFTTSTEDILHHLKLLRAFAELKKRVTPNDDEKKWQVYITHAVRRFIVFLSCIKHVSKTNIDWGNEKKMLKNARDPKLVEFLLKILPPLDVVMVWHTFMLNPRTFYDTFTREGLLLFAMIPLPLYRLSCAIDNYTFEYLPDEKQQSAYVHLLEHFLHGNSLNQIQDLTRFDNSSFVEHEYLIDVICPNCSQIILWNIPYTNDLNTGFADSGFVHICKVPCKCVGFSSTITHEELRKRQMFADAHSSKPLPGIFKYFSTAICHSDLKDIGTMTINKFVLREAKNGFGDLSRSLEKIIIDACHSTVHGPRVLLLLRSYCEMNLVHTTVHSENIPTFEVPLDLVGCVLRQERFIQKMNDIDILSSPEVELTLTESSVRYERFFHLLSASDYKQMLVPTLDIDLVWHTHQLSMVYYFEACLSAKCGVIDHDDKIAKGRIDDSFEKTAHLYKKKYKQDYLICLCWYCTLVRAKSPKVSSIFGSKMKAVPKVEEKSTHISAHYAINMPSQSAQAAYDKVEDKYHRNMSLPWEFKEEDPKKYVFPPSAPIPHCQFYGDSLCGTVRDFGPNCTGVVGTLCGSVLPKYDFKMSGGVYGYTM